MTPTIEIHTPPEVTDALPSLGRVIVATDAGDERLATARHVATRLAAEFGWELVLYDRSDEHWTDTPHPSGPLRADDVPLDTHEHLARQMRDIEAAGVPVMAWLATVPAITAMLDAIQEMAVDAVLLPDEQSRPKLMDRVASGDGPAGAVERVVELQLGKAPLYLELDDELNLTARSHPEGGS